MVKPNDFHITLIAHDYVMPQIDTLQRPLWHEIVALVAMICFMGFISMGALAL